MSKPYMIAIAGGSGSGKTTIVELIHQHFTSKPILVFSQDHYYRDLSHLSSQQRAQVNFDHPDQVDTELLFQHIHSLAQGQSIDQPTYDFATHTRRREATIVQAAPVIIFDGIFSLYYEAIRNLFDLKLFVEVCDDLRFIRRLQRDLQKRGRSMDSVISQYLNTVRPMHLKFVEPTKAYADLVIYWERKNGQIIDMITSLLKSL